MRYDHSFFNEHNRAAIKGPNSDLAQQSKRPPTLQRYSHILVPCRLNDADQAALTLGAEIACRHGARLSILHVSPVLDDGPSVHWLDAIDRLYRALDNRSVTTAERSSDLPERPGKQLGQFVYQHIPQQLRSSLDLDCISLRGDTASSIARYANDSDVDLVIMSCRIPRWWQSALPSTVQRVMRLTQKQILSIRPEAFNGHRSAGD